MEFTSEEKSLKGSSTHHGWIPARYVLTIMGFFGIGLNYMLRINVSIGLVAMIWRNDSRSSLTSIEGEGEFHWDDRAQSLITGSFFWGYVFTQIPGGRLAEVFSAKYIFGLSIFLSGVLTVLIPWLAEENPAKLIALRVALGLAEGSTYPAMNVMLAKWAPPGERSKMTAIIYSGAQAGTVLTLPLLGTIISLSSWRVGYYVIGFLPVIWTTFWFLCVFDTPQSHPRIGMEELSYLNETIPAPPPSHAGKKQVPWRQILTSSPFYAIIVCGVASNWGFCTLLALMPTYLKTMLHYDIQEDSLLSAIPYLFSWIFSICYGAIADYLRCNGKLSTKNLRKLSCLISIGIPAITLFAQTFVGTNAMANLILFAITVGLNGAKYSSYLGNHIDLSPNYAGTLLGIENTCSSFPGWIGPLVASKILDNHETLSSWHQVFYITSVVYVIGCIYYLIFASGEIQPWNDVMDDDSNIEMEKAVDLAVTNDSLSSDHQNHLSSTKTEIL